MSSRLKTLVFAAALAVLASGARDKVVRAHNVYSKLGLVFLVLAYPRQLLGSFALSVLARWLTLGFAYFYAGRFLLTLPVTALGKRADGSVALWSRIAFFPYRAFEASFIRVVQKRLRKRGQTPYSQVAADAQGKIFVGERLHKGADLPPNIGLVVDLTNEFAERPSVKAAGGQYMSIPVWDQCLPQDEGRYARSLREAADFKGDVFVHCIMGRGRSSCAAALIMLRRGMASSATDAYEKIRAARPVVHWAPKQMEFVRGQAQVFLGERS